MTREQRKELEQVLRQRKADGLIVHRANALLLLDDGIGTFEVARVLYLDAETIRGWRRHFIKQYNCLCNALMDDEAVVFGDAVHPEHQSCPAPCWFLRESRPTIAAIPGRKRINIHGVLNLETFQFQFGEVEKINAETTTLQSALFMCFSTMHAIITQRSCSPG